MARANNAEKRVSALEKEVRSMRGVVSEVLGILAGAHAGARKMDMRLKGAGEYARWVTQAQPRRAISQSITALRTLVPATDRPDIDWAAGEVSHTGSEFVSFGKGRGGVTERWATPSGLQKIKDRQARYRKERKAKNGKH